MTSARAPTGPVDIPIVGAELLPMQMHRDDRGIFTEIFREEWGTGVSPVQWNVVRSAANVLRGVHVHVKHADYLVLVDGRATVGLRDLRPGSPSENVATTVGMNAEELAALVTPPGVAHGFYFYEPSCHIYSVTHYWDMADELGCRWDDPALEIQWDIEGEPRISQRDVALPPLSGLAGKIPRYRPPTRLPDDAP